jgi:hypothetical protein
MGATVPFRNHNLDSQHIEAMRAAFEPVCDVLQLNGNTEDPLTELVVLEIVKLAVLHHELQGMDYLGDI